MDDRDGKAVHILLLTGGDPKDEQWQTRASSEHKLAAGQEKMYSKI